MIFLLSSEENLIKITAARDEFKDKSEELETSFEKCKVDLKEYVHKEKLASETMTDLSSQNAKYRVLLEGHE